MFDTLAPPQRVKEIFNRARQLKPDERSAYLDQACGSDANVRPQVESLLNAYVDAGSFLDSPTLLPDAQPTQPQLPIEAAGTIIGRYKLLQPIGEGGFGSVWMAEQREPVSRRVALKIIKLGMDTRQVIARFEVERQALAMMDHPNIAKVLDAGATDAGRPYFVMELVKGDRITDYCDRHQLPLRKRLELFIDTCHAVQHAHTKGIIHRDLKPSNVLVTQHDERPVPKVIDFGIAKATTPLLSSLAGLTTAGTAAVQLTDKTLFTDFRALIGTPTYMSPEQAELTAVDIDTRSDVYSLGVLLYELLTGTTPFDSRTLLDSGYDEMRRVIREVEPPTPSTRLSTLSFEPEHEHNGATPREIAARRDVDFAALQRQLRGDLDWIVMKCLEKDRTRRYETANGLAADVRHFLSGEPVVAAPPSAGYRLGKFIRRHKVGVAASVAIGAALVLGIAGTTAGMAWALREQARAEQRAKETQQVSDFQAAMLSDIDIEAMGRGFKERYRKQVRAALERQYVGEFPSRRKRTPEEIEAEMVAFDERAEPAQAVDVARQVMDEFVLAPTADALEEQFADQPLVRAQLHEAIGGSYADWGLYNAAEPHLQLALEIRRRELGPEHELLAASLSELGVLLLDWRDYTAAEPLLREALAMRRKLLGHEHPAVASSLHNLAGLLTAAGDRAAAEPLYRDALAMRRTLLGDEHPDVVQTLKNLGDLLTDKGDYAAAEPLLRESLASARKLYGDGHPDTANSLSTLAKLLDYKGDYAAEPMFREALAIARKAYGDGHPYVASSLSNLGSALTTKGDYAAAEPLFLEALAIRRRVFGDGHPYLEGNLRMVVVALQRQDEHAAAEPFCRELLELARKKPEDNVNLAAALARLGMNLIRQRSFAEAALPLRECVALRGTLFPDGHSEAWLKFVATSALGEALASQGVALIESDALAAISKFAEAEPLLVESGRWLTENADRIPQRFRAEQLRQALERITFLYESWEIVAPASGKAELAAEWRAELENLAGP